MIEFSEGTFSVVLVVVAVVVVVVEEEEAVLLEFVSSLQELLAIMHPYRHPCPAYFSQFPPISIYLLYELVREVK